MAKEKPRLLKVGKNGEVKLPLDVLDAIGHENGEDVRIFVDTRRKQIRLERYVDDPWADAGQFHQVGIGYLWSSKEIQCPGLTG